LRVDVLVSHKIPVATISCKALTV